VKRRIGSEIIESFGFTEQREWGLKGILTRVDVSSVN